MAFLSEITCPACFKELDEKGTCRVCGWFKGHRNQKVGKGFGDVAVDLDLRFNAIVALRHIQKERELFV